MYSSTCLAEVPLVGECTHFIDDVAHKVSTPITQEPSWGPEDQDVTLI